MVGTVQCNFFFVVCFLAGSTFSLLCPKTEKYQVIDWERFSEQDRMWFDGLDIPSTAGSRIVDCWDLHHFTKVADGFTFNVTQYINGRPEKDFVDVLFHMIRKPGETYIMDPKLKSTFVTLTKKSYDHLSDRRMDEEIEKYADVIFRGRYFFMTNYDTYLVLAGCAPGKGLIGFSHFNTMTPTAKTIYDVWNAFADYGQVTHVGWEDICFNREK